MERESIAAVKSRGLAGKRNQVVGKLGRRGVMCFQANGFSITLRIHFTMSQNVLTCRTSWLATSMEELIWGISIGDGNPMAAIWRGEFLLPSLAVYLYNSLIKFHGFCFGTMKLKAAKLWFHCIDIEILSLSQLSFGRSIVPYWHKKKQLPEMWKLKSFG